MDSAKAKRILVVDDETVIASTLGLIFRQAGFESAWYNDPVDLLQACESETPDAVVSDVMMPGMNGIELSLRLVELYPACKVILVSGQAATSDLLLEAHQHGHVFDVLSKPVHAGVLIQHVRRALGNPAAKPRTA